MFVENVILHVDILIKFPSNETSILKISVFSQENVI